MHNHSECKRLLGTLSLYLDGEAEEALCTDIERHMAECPTCRIVLDTLSRTIKLYQEHGHATLPGGARRRLYAALHLEDYLQDSDT